MKQTVHQQDFFEQYRNSKIPDEKQLLYKWLSLGEVNARSYFSYEQEKTYWAGTLWDIQVTVPLPTESAALEQARRVRDNYAAETTTVEIDMHKLLIAGNSYKQALQYHSLSLPYIVHLGIELTNGQPYDEPLLNFLEYLDTAKLEGKLARLSPMIANIEHDDLDAYHDAVSDILIENGFYGIAIQVSTPVRQYINTRTYNYDWSLCHTQWVYGETFEDALGQADLWRQLMKEQDMAKCYS
jgi:hypothetical protein